jgi:hypothetical protein
MTDHYSGRPAHIAEDEWEARVALAACYRMVAKLGLDDMIYNHISLRVPGRPDQFLLNPYGLLFERDHGVEPGEASTCEGRKLDDTPARQSTSAFVIHAPSTRAAMMPPACCTRIRMPACGVRAGAGPAAPVAVRDALLPAAGLPRLRRRRHRLDEQARLVRDFGAPG